MRFIWVPEKVPGKFLEGALVQSQVKFNKVPERVPEKVWEALVQTQLRYFQPLGALENKTLRLLGIPPKLISNAMEH